MGFSRSEDEPYYIKQANRKDQNIFFQIQIYICMQNHNIQLTKSLTNTKMAIKRSWSQQEDQYLREQANSSSIKNWVKIAQNFNKKFNGELRTAKQCRQRFINHASNSILNPFQNSWDEKSQKQLFELYSIYGSKWTLISQKISNKSQNLVKNKFYCSLRKFIRKLNKFLKSGKNKYKKQIRYESIIRFMQAHQSFYDLPQDLRAWSLEIRRKIIFMTEQVLKNKQIEQEQLQNLSLNINKFNLQTRSYKAKKPRQVENAKNQQCLSNKSGNNKNSLTKIEYVNYIEGIQQQEECSNEQESLNQVSFKPEAEMLSQAENCQPQNLKNQSFLSQEELFEDFGNSISQSPRAGVDNQKNMLQLMFPQAFPAFGVEGFQV